MSEQKNDGNILPHYPNTDDRNAWRTYWDALGEFWRTEPEIDEEQQKFLSEHRIIQVDIEQGIYPFKGIKLSRADVEWLLSTLEKGRRSTDWNDVSQRKHEGLDLRGANLRQANLSGLPLRGIHGGLFINNEERETITIDQCQMAAVDLQEANLYMTHLEGANLYMAHLEGANLGQAHLEGADLREAHLEGCYLRGAFLDKTTYLRDVILGNKAYGFVLLAGVHWSDANLSVINWSQMRILGDEDIARQQKKRNGVDKDTNTRISEFERAVRANRLLAAALQAQGINEYAAHFAYRAQICQRHLLLFETFENVEQEPKLSWFALRLEKPPFYLGMFALLFGVFLVSLCFLLIFPFTAPGIGNTIQGHIIQIASTVVAVLSGGICLFCFLLDQPIIRLSFLFALLSLLDGVLLFLALFLLISLVLNPGLRFLLIALAFLTALILATLWIIQTTPPALRMDFDLLFRGAIWLWRKLKNKGEQIWAFVLPFLQTQRNFGRYVFSLLLGMLAGYGYRPARTLFWYLLVIFAFATCYYTLNGQDLRHRRSEIQESADDGGRLGGDLSFRPNTE